MALKGSLGGQPLLDPIQERLNWQQSDNKWPLPEEFRYANCLAIPLGPDCARGHLLLSRGSLNQLNLNANQTLIFQDDIGNTAVFNGLIFLNARNVSPGQDGDPAATYLVEVADARWLCGNPHFHVVL